MDEQQAFRAIRNAIRLESLGRDVAAKVTPQLREAYKYLQELIANLPEEAIGRELRYRQLSDLIRATLNPVSETTRELTTEAIVEEIPHQFTYAEKILGAGNSLPALQLTRTQLVAMATDTKVLGKRIDQLFGEGTFTKAQITKVDRVVKQGFLLGETNQQIARNLSTAFNGSRRDVTAVVRTAVMDMSQRAQETFWDANNNFDWVDPETGETREVRLIKLWEFDATFDYRVCPQCYPYDGKRVKERSDLPTVPVHPNCRCRILPLTATALELEKEDMENGMTASIVEVNKKERDAQGRIYKTKARVDGEKMFKSAREIKPAKAGQVPRMWDFIAQTTPDTRRAVLGEVRAAEFEYITSSNRGPKRKDLRDALMYVTNGDARSFAKAQRARRRGK